VTALARLMGYEPDDERALMLAAEADRDLEEAEQDARDEARLRAGEAARDRADDPGRRAQRGR
jgi:hypothetical protein